MQSYMQMGSLSSTSSRANESNLASFYDERELVKSVMRINKLDLPSLAQQGQAPGSVMLLQRQIL